MAYMGAFTAWRIVLNLDFIKYTVAPLEAAVVRLTPLPLPVKVGSNLCVRMSRKQRVGAAPAPFVF